ncbi:MAG: glycosyltransferase [Acetobacteraceae bacterium]|nr:glycosyltransferase [Acetobacteraceae bacterium]
MTLLSWVVAVVTALALLPALMMLVNLLLFRRPGPPDTTRGVSVIIPARNEEAAIGRCLAQLGRSTLASIEIIVVDDGSTDRTAEIVRTAASRDPRIRLLRAPALPPGWSGKMHACHFGATEARHPLLCFIDTDVQLAPDALPRLAGYQARRGVPLVSGFPREIAASAGERLLIPLIQVLLLAYLPLAAMRLSRAPGFGAGCGQLMLADASAYRAIGGHAAIRSTWHDGLALPRAFRRSNFQTDIVEASRIASCRMYVGFGATWRGFSKNATEGMATPAGLPVWTLLLLGGFVLPVPLFLLCLGVGHPAAAGLGGAIAALAVARTLVGLRCGQDARAMALTPAGMACLLVLLWVALSRHMQGAKQAWRGRLQASP